MTSNAEDWIVDFTDQMEMDKRSLHRGMILKVLPHLEREDLDVSKLTRVFYKSRRQLYREIHDLSGLPVAQWIRLLRLHRARWLIDTGEITSVIELADKSGFARADYFRSLYRDYFGTDPAHYFYIPREMALSD